MVQNCQSKGIGNTAITTPATSAPGTTFQSTNDSFRTVVPDGWTVHDLNNTGSMLSEELRQGYGILAQLCPGEEQPLQPGAAASNTTTSNNSCQGVQEEVAHVIRYPDLNTRVAAANNFTNPANTSMTIEDVLSYNLQKLQEVGYRNIQIVNTSDTRVNITSPLTNQTIATAPAKLVETTYTTGIASNDLRKSYFLLTATATTSPNVGTIKGYSVFYEVIMLIPLVMLLRQR